MLWEWSLLPISPDGWALQLMPARSVCRVMGTPLLCKTPPSLQGSSCDLLENFSLCIQDIIVGVRGKGFSDACEERIISPFHQALACWLWTWRPVQASLCWQRNTDLADGIEAFYPTRVAQDCSAAAPVSSQQAGEILPLMVSSLEHISAVNSYNFVMSSFCRIRPKLSCLLMLTQNIYFEWTMNKTVGCS